MTNPDRSRWTPEVVLGLLALLASLILPYLDVPVGVSTACGLFAAWLLGPVPSPFTPPRSPDQRGHARASVLLGFVAFALIAVGMLLLSVKASGCALLERRQSQCTTPPRMVLEDMPDGTCAARAFCDGHEVQTSIGPGPCGEVEER